MNGARNTRSKGKIRVRVQFPIWVRNGEGLSGSNLVGKAVNSDCVGLGISVLGITCGFIFRDVS